MGESTKSQSAFEIYWPLVILLALTKLNLKVSLVIKLGSSEGSSGGVTVLPVGPLKSLGHSCNFILLFSACWGICRSRQWNSLDTIFFGSALFHFKNIQMPHSSALTANYFFPFLHSLLDWNTSVFFQSRNIYHLSEYWYHLTIDSSNLQWGMVSIYHW